MGTKRYGFTNASWRVAAALQLMSHSDDAKRGGLVVGNVADDAPGIARRYFSSEVPRAWLKANKDWIGSFSPEFYQALIDEIDGRPLADEVPDVRYH